MMALKRILQWIENRSPLTRWVLVPIIFFVSSFLIHTAVLIVVWLLSFIPNNIGPDADSRFIWLQVIIGANALSTYGSAIVSGWVAPKFKYPAVCLGASFYIITNLWLLYYGIGTADFSWSSDDVWTMISIIGGATAAVIHAKDIFSN